MPKPTLQAGLTAEQEFTVTAAMGTPHLANPVLATPFMIQMTETTCRELLTPHMEEGEESVGFHVDVHHYAPVKIGEHAAAKVTLRQFRDGRKAFFDVAVYHESGAKIGEGTHAASSASTASAKAPPSPADHRR